MLMSIGKLRMLNEVKMYLLKEKSPSGNPQGAFA